MACKWIPVGFWTEWSLHYSSGQSTFCLEVVHAIPQLGKGYFPDVWSFVWKWSGGVVASWVFGASWNFRHRREERQVDEQNCRISVFDCKGKKCQVTKFSSLDPVGTASAVTFQHRPHVPWFCTVIILNSCEWIVINWGLRIVQSYLH